jgi:hypothetical protein
MPNGLKEPLRDVQLVAALDLIDPAFTPSGRDLPLRREPEMRPQREIDEDDGI